MDKSKLKAYHRANVLIITVLLIIWALVSYGGALIAKALSKAGTTIFGFPAHYWISAQFSVITFVIEIFVYAWLMNRLDQKYGVEE
ncbi:MAG TPA: DUF4212 domain-containing protein [Aquificaceae bacterium]|nr:DUF4212 domain-containing protein [Aquificaceae bacterium]HIQ49393.1 DUF4212 domain-containing protein [Aquifex aeolicus]